jgi:hypothetical protein
MTLVAVIRVYMYSMCVSVLVTPLVTPLVAVIRVYMYPMCVASSQAW